MAFTSDTAKKAGEKSSRAGTPNKSTNEIRENFQMLFESNLEKLQEDLNKLEPEQRIKALLDMAKFVLPTLKSTELTTEVNIGAVLGSLPVEEIQRINKALEDEY